MPKIRVGVPRIKGYDDSLFPLLGYRIGEMVGSDIPIIHGLEDSNPGVADLKAFGAGFATTSSASMFHIRGVTPEAAVHEGLDGLEHLVADVQSLGRSWKRLNTATDSSVDLISLGNPHFAFEEFPPLVKLVEGQVKRKDVEFIITTNRFIYEKAVAAGYIGKLELFGAKFITDTCWCMIEEPVIPPRTRNIMTNSAKYAHYGPGMVRRKYHFGSMAGCVEAACLGRRTADDIEPRWLFA